MKTSCLKNRGFSLIEVLITLVVLGAGLMALARFQATVLQDSSLAKQRTEAVTAGQSMLEQFRGFTTLVQYDAFQDDSDTFDGDNTAYTRDWQFNPVSPDFSTVTMDVAWPDKDGNFTADSQITLNTIISATDPAVPSNPPGGAGLALPTDHDDQPAGLLQNVVCVLGLLC